MTVATTDAVQVIDSKITETERELERLRRSAELLPIVASNLAALRRTRALLAGEDPDAEMKPTPPPVNGHRPMPSKATSASGAMMDLIRNAAAPMHGRDITSKVNSMGFVITRASAEGQLARWVKEGKLRRTAPSTYTAT